VPRTPSSGNLPRKFCRLAALGLTLGACSPPGPLRVAVVMTPDTLIAAELAAADINAAGGLQGSRLELLLVPETHAGLTGDAIATAERLAADPTVLAVIGHRGSSVSLAASQVYNARRLPQIAPNSTSPFYSQTGPFSFRLVASDLHQARFIAEKIGSLSPVPRVAVLYVNDDYGRDFHHLLQAALSEKGRPAILEAPFLEGAGPFAQRRDELLRSLEAARPDLLVWLGRSEEIILLRRELRSKLPHLRVLGSDSMSSEAGFAHLAEFRGDWLVSLVDLAAPDPALQSFAARYEAASGHQLTDSAALTFDAVGLVAAAIRDGATDREGIRRYLAGLAASERPFSGIVGPIQLDANGDARPAYVLMEVTGEGWRVIG
jgi:branched-chain amino acid transport system substrate-binding protein